MLFLDALGNYRKYGSRLSTYDAVKCFAVIVMIIDHMGHFFFPDQLWWRAVGRMCVPIWFFMAGYGRPSQRSNQMMILGLLMIVADGLMVQPLLPVNVLLSIMICRMVILHIQSYDVDMITLFLLALALLITSPVTVNLFEYGAEGILFALWGYYYRFHRDKTRVVLGCLVIAYLVFIVAEQAGFRFSTPQFYFMSIATLGVCLYLQRFTLQYIDVPAEKQPLAKAVMFIGRNTLYIYFIHYVLFEILNYAMHPPAFFKIRWLL